MTVSFCVYCKQYLHSCNKSLTNEKIWHENMKHNGYKMLDRGQPLCLNFEMYNHKDKISLQWFYWLIVTSIYKEKTKEQ